MHTCNRCHGPNEGPSSHVPGSRHCKANNARALWAVRVLDAWADANRNWPGPETVKCDYRRRGEWGCMVGFEDLSRSTRRQAYYATTPEAARLAAAQAVFPSLPADVRAKLGECP